MPDAQTLPTSFTITPNVTGDEIINVASQTAGTNGFSVKLEHEAPFSSAKTAKTASTTAMSGYGSSGSIKVPKVSVDKFGHVTELTEETVTINMPAAQTLPTSFNINATGTGDAVISVVGTGGANSVHYSVTHDEAGTAYTSGNTTTSIKAGESKTIKIPQITVDKYGHTNTAADENVTITIPAAPKVQTIAVNDDDVVNLTVSTSGTTTTITGTHIDDKTAYTSSNTTVSVDVAEGEEKIKIPQLTTDKYGHVVVAADEEITFKAIQFKGDYNASTNKAATMADVTAAVADLNGAMHFEGVVETEPNGATPTGYSAGDVVIYQQKDAEGKVSVAIEYVFDGTTWYKLGDESLPQKIVDEAIAELKLGAITNKGNVDSTTVDIITSLSQSSGVVGGSKETLNFNTAPSDSNKIATMDDITSKINGLDVTGVDLTQAETINVLKQTNGKISVSKQSILITADQVSDFDDRVGDSINELDWTGLDLTPGETVNTISQTDGKVTGTKQSIAITASQVTDFATEVGKLFPSISVTTDDDGMAKVSAEATGHSLTINTSHAEIGNATTSTANSGSVSGYGASKTISIPRVSTDKWGHVTSITNDSVAITMPSVSDTKMTQTVKADNVNYPLLAAASASPASGAASTGVYDTGMTMNPSTNTIKATIFQGNLDGVADAAQLLSDSGGNPLTVGTTTRPVYFNAGKPTALTEDVAPHRAGIYFVKDTAGASTTAGTWKAQCNDITEYYDGLTIALQVPIAGASTTTLNINNLGGKTVYRYGTSKVTSTHYAAGTVIILVYSANKNAWYTTDYDSNTDTKVYTVLNTTTKAYILGTTTTPTTSNKAVTTIADTGVYLDTTAGTLTATTFKGNLNGNASSADLADAVQGTLKIQVNGTDKISYNGSTSPTLNIATVATTGSYNDLKNKVPNASGTVAGITKVYPAASCTTYTSDEGTCTPLAVQNSAKKFAITRPSSTTEHAITRYTNTTGDVENSKIIIEDVTNTRDTSKTANVIAIPAEGNKKMVYGYCTDQVDGTSFIGGVFPSDATEYPYTKGLAIGGTSGNLLWKGNKVATINDIPTSLKNPNSLTIQRNGSTIGSYDGSSAKTINIQASSVTLNGTATNSASFYAPTTAGTSGYPLISSGGAPTFTTLKDSYIEWGGRNLTGSISPTDMATSSIHSANRFAFAKSAGITIEYSTDAGSTWTDYGSSDEVKIGLVSNINQALYIGARTGTSNSAPVNTVNDRLRVTLKATSMGVYTRLQKLLIYITTNYAKGCKVLIEKSNKGSATTFSTVGTYDISGWSGWNSIPLTANFGGGDTQTSNYDSIRLTFYCTALTSGNYNNALTLINIVGLGETYWAYPSQMALDGHIYSYDTTQGVMFPSTLTCVNGLAVNNSNRDSTIFSIMSGANKDYSKQSLISILSDSNPYMRTGFMFLDSNDAGKGITLLMGIKDNGVLGVGDTVSHSDDSLAAVHSDNDLLNGETLSTLTAAATTTTSSRQYAVERDANGKLSVNVPWSNSDTKVTQVYDATTNANIPLLFSATSGITSTASRGATTAKLNNKFYVNPSTGGLYATKVYGAVWNDYAECRAQKEEIEPGYCVASGDDGKVYKTNEKFQACDGIVSDTFGFSIGETDSCKTPLAVAGRVLAYAENPEELHSGDTVCAGPNGKIVKMTREEIREWPDRIVGIVSEIPTYETWGTGGVLVDGRIWIKVK